MKTKTTSGDQATRPDTDVAAQSGPYLTPIELAVELKVSVRTVTRYRAAGMPARGRGKFIRYHLPDVREWVRNYLGGMRHQ